MRADALGPCAQALGSYFEALGSDVEASCFHLEAMGFDIEVLGSCIWAGLWWLVLTECFFGSGSCTSLVIGSCGLGDPRSAFCAVRGTLGILSGALDLALGAGMTLGWGLGLLSRPRILS